MNFSKKLRSTADSEDEVSFNDSNGSNGSYFDSEDDCEYRPSTKRTRTITNVSSNNGIQRRPTRVPNLKIQNRNALLARENRKRKKEEKDLLENKVYDLQEQNKKLLKMVKSKDSRTIKLEQEVRYLKSVIANRTEIVSVLKSLPKFPVKSSNIKDNIIKEEHASGSETASCKSFEENDHDVATEWDEILRNPFNSSTDFSGFSKLDDVDILSPASSPLSEISTEHNYFDKSSLMSNEGGAGVCVHLNNGRVSLEFCSTCHYNATNTWVGIN